MSSNLSLGELTTILGVDSTQLDKAAEKMKKFGDDARSATDTANKSLYSQMGILEGIEKQLEALRRGKKQAMSVDEIATYNEEIKKAEADLKEFGEVGMEVGGKMQDSFQAQVKILAAIGAAVMIAKEGWQLYGSVMMSTSGTAAQFESVMGGINTATDRFMQMIATGDLTNFVQNLQDAAKAGQDYANAMNQIEERKMGQALEKAYSGEGQMMEETKFRDRKLDPAKRQEALNRYKAEAVRLATQELGIASATVGTEEKKLRAVGITAEKIEYLYKTYNTGILKVQDAEEKRAKLEKLSAGVRFAENNRDNLRYLENLEKAKKAYTDYYASLTEGEKLYVDLLNENSKISREDLALYLKALQNEAEAKTGIIAINKQNLRVENQIATEIESQKKDIIDIEKAKKEAAGKSAQASYVAGGNEAKLGSRFFATMMAEKKKQEAPANDITKDMMNRGAYSAAQKEGLDVMAKQRKEYLDKVEKDGKKEQKIAEETMKKYEEMGQSLSSSLRDGAASWKEYGQSVLGAVRQIISGLIAEALATAITNAIKQGSKLGPAAAIAIPAFAALAVGAANTAINQIPGLAAGGIAYGDTLARVGEYPGASTNPEIIAPLNKLQSMIGKDRQQVHVSVEGSISGRDITLALRRNQ